MKPTEAEVLQAIEQILAQELQQPRQVKLTDELMGDLELDSITLITLLATLENRYRVCMPKQASAEVKTIGDLIQLLLKTSSEVPET